MIRISKISARKTCWAIILQCPSCRGQLSDGNFDEARYWCNRVLKAYQQSAEANCRIAAIIYDDELLRTGIPGEEVTHLSSEGKSKALADIDKALTSLDTAIEIRPDYLIAMAYQNLLLREKLMLVEEVRPKT